MVMSGGIHVDDAPADRKGADVFNQRDVGVTQRLELRGEVAGQGVGFAENPRARRQRLIRQSPLNQCFDRCDKNIAVLGVLRLPKPAQATRGDPAIGMKIRVNADVKARQDVRVGGGVQKAQRSFQTFGRGLIGDDHEMRLLIEGDFRLRQKPGQKSRRIGAHNLERGLAIAKKTIQRVFNFPW